MIIKIEIELPEPTPGQDDPEEVLSDAAVLLSSAVLWNRTDMVFSREPSGPIWWHDELVGRWERS